MTEKSGWTRKVELDPDHSHWYVQRFRLMAAAGEDLHGEARFVDAMLPRGARILDAGCGSGRLAGRLHELGHDVVGVDVDPILIEAAIEDHPGPAWYVQDLADLDLAAVGEVEPFDAIVSAGNVMAFLHPTTRRPVLSNLRDALATQGRIAVGFGAGRGYPFEEFLADVGAVGLVPDLLLSTWDLRPWSPEDGFLVAVLRRAE